MTRYQLQPVLNGFVWGISASLLLAIVAPISCRIAMWVALSLPRTRADGRSSEHFSTSSIQALAGLVAESNDCPSAIIHGTHKISVGGRFRWLRFRFSVKTVALVVIFALVISLLQACGGDDPLSLPTVNTTPSREDIIQAVRRYVESKTYTTTTNRTIERQEPRRYSCSQTDVELDPYMPHNPELAKCPYVGATYTRRETVQETHTEQETRNCEPLPGPEYGWQVVEIGDNKWRVSHSGKEWEVEKLSGESRSAGDYIKMSNFSFAIKANHEC